MQTDNLTPEAAMVEVTQADRDAAAQVAISSDVEAVAFGLALARHRLAASPPPVTGGEGALREASDEALAQKAYGKGYEWYRNKWIGDHTEMNADLVRCFVPRPATPATGGTEASDPDWFKRNADDRNPKAAIRYNPAYFAMECAAAIVTGRLVPATGGTFADGAEAREPHSVEWCDLVAAIKNDGMLFEQFATRMFECWRGTGTMMEEGSASNDYRVWGNEAHNRFLHLKALLRDIRALHPGAGREDGVTVDQYNAAFDPANEAGGNAYRAGFEEGWIFAQSPDGTDYDDLKEQYGRVVDIEPSEAWDGYRDTFFAALPLAALPTLATPPQKGSTDV